MTMNLRRVFLSHASKNLKEVLRLDCHLRRHGVPLWRDRVDLPKGVPTEDEIRKAGEEAIGFAFYLTEAAAESEWVRRKELGHAIRNASLDHSFGMVPIFRDDKDAVVNKMVALAEADDPRYDLRKNNGHIVRCTDDLELERELATAAAIVLRSTVRTLRKHAVSGSRLRIAAVTRNNKPWTTTPLDLAIDWSHLYPPIDGRLPNPGVGATQLLPPLNTLVDALGHEWGDKRLQIVPHCHPSLAVATGFAFRRGAGFDLEVLDHMTGERLSGPARPLAPESGLWKEEVTERSKSGKDIILCIGVSRDVVTEANNAANSLGLDVGPVLNLTPPGGCSNAAIASGTPLLQHRLAVAAVQRVVDLQTTAGVGTIHLFIAIPGTLAVLLGQQLTNVGSVQVYDFDNDTKRYVPVLTLCHK